MTCTNSKTKKTKSALQNLFDLDAQLQASKDHIRGTHVAVTIIVPRSSKKRKPGVTDMPARLRGPSHNKYGGYQTGKFKSYGGTFGAADKVHKARAAARRKAEDTVRKLGLME